MTQILCKIIKRIDTKKEFGNKRENNLRKKIWILKGRDGITSNCGGSILMGTDGNGWGIPRFALKGWLIGSLESIFRRDGSHTSIFRYNLDFDVISNNYEHKN